MEVDQALLFQHKPLENKHVICNVHATVLVDMRLHTLFSEPHCRCKVPSGGSGFNPIRKHKY